MFLWNMYLKYLVVDIKSFKYVGVFLFKGRQGGVGEN